MSFKNLFRINYIRNHFLRYGIQGIIFYLNLNFSLKKGNIIFNHSEYKNKIYLRKSSSDINTFYQVLFNLDYEIPIKFEPKTIIDLGANVGLASVYFLNKFPNSRVIAVEPEKNNFEILQKNTQNYPNFTAYYNGIWNKNAFLEIKDNKLGSWGFSVNEVATQNQDTINAISLNQIIENHNLTQIDIEGSEIELFLNNYEKWLSITKIIIIELHDWMRKGCSKQFFSTLVKYDFKLSHKEENLICSLKH